MDESAFAAMMEQNSALLKRLTENSDRGMIKKPDMFSGAPTDVNLWLFCMKRYLECKRIVDPGKQVLICSQFLTGDALQWFYNLASIGRTPNSFDAFDMALRSDFLPAEYQFQLHQRLQRLKQSGSMSSYVAAFRSIVAQIVDMSETSKVTAFIQGLKHQSQSELRYRAPRTLTEAMNMSLMFDSAKFGYRPYMVKPNSDVQPMDLGFLTANQKNEYMKAGKCFKCGQPGHLSRNCPGKAGNDNSRL